jgi:LPXTG-motif cell wall-anchored protein
MRKNVKKQLALRVLSTAALVAMVSSIATAAFAAEYNVKDGSVEIVAKNGVQSITQWADKDKGTFVKDKDGYINNRQDDDIILTTKNKDTGETETTSNTVTITAENNGDTANVTLRNVDIRQPDSHWSECTDPAPIEIKGNGSTKLELDGNNTVLSGNGKHAGIEKADVNGTGTLTIKDDKNDDGSDKDKDENGNAVDGDTGKLVAGGYYNGAGIGGGSYHYDEKKDYADTSNITITGGDITASGGYYGAGIGAGCYGDASNIRIEGNAHVTAFSDGSAAIGSGYHATGNSDITITDHATVEAASLDSCAIGSGHDSSDKVTITISGNASVNAQTRNSPAAIGSDTFSTTVNIEDNADVTAVGGYGVAIGTGYGHDSTGYHGATSTVINITGGTVNAVTRSNESKPAIGTVGGNLDLTINSSTGKTTVNAYTTGSDSLPLIGTADHYDSSTHKYDRISPSDGAEYNEDGSSNLGESNAAIINSYRNTPLGTDKYKAPKTLDDGAFHPTYEFQGTLYNAKYTLSDKDKGDLTKVVHNRKYMEKDPNIDITKLKAKDLHDWKLVKRVEPTLDADGYADYICSIDRCGQTKHVPLPKLTPEPSEPDTPSTPETPDTPDTPSTPDVPSTPEVTPDAPAQDGTAPADTPAADTTATAQNVAQNAEPEAAAAAPAAAAVLPQTGANWLAVVGSALSGMFLLAAGFVLDRKNRRMN